MAKGTTVKMWRRTLIVLIVMVALGFGLIVVSLIRLLSPTLLLHLNQLRICFTNG